MDGRGRESLIEAPESGAPPQCDPKPGATHQGTDLLRGVYERTARRHGYVSFEVSPLLANDTAGTIEEARRLWQALGRENVVSIS